MRPKFWQPRRTHRSGQRTGLALAAVGLVAIAATGCVFVQLEEGAEAVRVYEDLEAASACELTRRIGVTTKDGVGIFDRAGEDVELELERLARNHARGLGANAIVPLGPVDENGRREYDAFVCDPSD